MSTVIKTTVALSAEITVHDPRVLDLDRGREFTGKPFENVLALAKHLAVNLAGGYLTLSQLDGWADLPNDAITVKEQDAEVEWVHVEAQS